MSATTSVPATGKPPRRARRRLIALGVVTLAAGAGFAGLAAPAAFAGVDGGVNMDAACVAQYEPDATAQAGALGNVYTWICVDADGYDLGGINVNEQCAAQYGPGAVAQFSDYGDPYTWYCYTY